MSKGLRMRESRLFDGLQSCGRAVRIGGSLHHPIRPLSEAGRVEHPIGPKRLNPRDWFDLWGPMRLADKPLARRRR